jgi:hypothetical protein
MSRVNIKPKLNDKLDQKVLLIPTLVVIEEDKEKLI